MVSTSETGSQMMGMGIGTIWGRSQPWTFLLSYQQLPPVPRTDVRSMESRDQGVSTGKVKHLTEKWVKMYIEWLLHVSASNS